jgi:hypothetical protein
MSKDKRGVEQTRKLVMSYLHKQGADEPSRRFASGNGILAISGRAGHEVANERYGVDLTDQAVIARFQAMLLEHGYEKTIARDAWHCAEAHLWMTLDAIHHEHIRSPSGPRNQHSHPRHVAIWVYELTRKQSLKEDSPCENCRQWARLEFDSVNGTKRQISG